MEGVTENVTIEHHEEEITYPIAQFDYHHVALPFIVTLWVLVASGTKTLFHLWHSVTKIVPESCVLVVLGILLSLIIWFGDIHVPYELESETFFLFLLPPIVFDAGYFMPNRAFFQNIGTILLYAVVGTLWNAITIGLLLFGCEKLGWFLIDIPLLHILTFSSLISAVDPVAVLAVFEDIHVNEVLHILVFGESLLNDAVTIVLYHMMEIFSEIGEENITAVNVLSGCANFFCVSLGGTGIGVMFGLITAFVTKYTDHVRVIEPIFVFAFSYLSYLCAEVFHFSGIMSIVFCGITMHQYVEENISHKSHTTIKYFLKMLASLSEAVIFMFLGLSTISKIRKMDLIFSLVTLVGCLVFRFAGTYLLTFFANKFRVEKLDWSQQFIMGYGGIRGGVAYCLVVLLKPELVSEDVKEIFEGTTIIVIFFTVFVQGITIKPLVEAFHIKTTEKRRPQIVETVSTRVVDHLMGAIEEISGLKGENWIREHYEYINNTYLRPVLLRDKPVTKEMNMMRSFTKMNMHESMQYVKSNQAIFLAPSGPSSTSLSSHLRHELAQDYHADNGRSPWICYDMNQLASRPSERDLEDLEGHRAAIEGIGSRKIHYPSDHLRVRRHKGRQQFTAPRYFLPESESAHHLQVLALPKALIKEREHKVSHHEPRPPTKNVSFALPDVSQAARKSSLPTNQSLADLMESANSARRDGRSRLPEPITEHSSRPEVLADADEDLGGISFTVGPSNDSPDESNSPVAVESYLPWKSSAGSSQTSPEEAEKSFLRMLPPGREKSLDDWDNELPTHAIRDELVKRDKESYSSQFPVHSPILSRKFNGSGQHVNKSGSTEEVSPTGSSALHKSPSQKKLMSLELGEEDSSAEVSISICDGTRRTDMPGSPLSSIITNL